MDKHSLHHREVSAAAEQSANDDTQKMLFLVLGIAGAICLVVIIVSVTLVRRWRVKQDNQPPKERDVTGSAYSFPTGPQLHTVVIPQSVQSDSATSSSVQDYPPVALSGAAGGSDTTTSTFVPSPTHLALPPTYKPLNRQSELGSLRPELYKSSAAETEESETDGSETERPAGKLWLSTYYVSASSLLSVTLIKAKYYLSKTKYTQSLRDPFIRLYLLPDEKHFQISRYRGRSTSPRLNETFEFQLQHDDIANRTLRVSVYDLDKRKVRHTLGHALLPLVEIDFSSGPVIVCRNLETTSQPMPSCGELQTSLCHVPYMSKLKLVVHAAKGLTTGDTRPPDSYVKVQLYQGRKLLKSKKTGVVRNSPDPTFDEHFSFNIAGRQLDTLSIVLILVTVQHRDSSVSPADTGTSNPVTSSGVISRSKGTKKSYYRMVLGSFMFARGAPLAHWQEMATNPRTTITRWHPLSPV